MIIHGVDTIGQHNGIYLSMTLKEIPLFPDVRMQKILITISYYNKFSIILIQQYTLVF